MNFPVTTLSFPPLKILYFDHFTHLCVCVCKLWVLNVSLTPSFSPLFLAFSFSLLLLLTVSLALCSVQYISICRPAPTGLMGSIGVHRAACMAAVAWLPVLLP